MNAHDFTRAHLIETQGHTHTHNFFFHIYRWTTAALPKSLRATQHMIFHNFKTFIFWNSLQILMRALPLDECINGQKIKSKIRPTQPIYDDGTMRWIDAENYALNSIWIPTIFREKLKSTSPLKFKRIFTLYRNMHMYIRKGYAVYI